MEPRLNQPPLVVIIGETASGKSALAVELAEQFGGEIIAADSRTIYRDLEISTARPSAADRIRTPHHLLGFLSPSQSFSAAQFKERAIEKLQDIAGRGHVPFLVGGSGLYVDAVLYDFTFTQKLVDLAKRQLLNSLTVDELQVRIRSAGLAMPKDSRNPRRLIRVLETGGLQGQRHALRPNTLIIGLEVEREELRSRVIGRINMMFESGLVEEIKSVADKYGWDAPALQSPGFAIVRSYLEGQASLEATKDHFIREHMQLAKRQRTWFKRNKSIHWICKKEQAVDLITTLMNSKTIAKS